MHSQRLLPLRRDEEKNNKLNVLYRGDYRTGVPRFHDFSWTEDNEAINRFWNFGWVFLEAKTVTGHVYFSPSFRSRFLENVLSLSVSWSRASAIVSRSRKRGTPPVGIYGIPYRHEDTLFPQQCASTVGRRANWQFTRLACSNRECNARVETHLHNSDWRSHAREFVMRQRENYIYMTENNLFDFCMWKFRFLGVETTKSEIRRVRGRGSYGWSATIMGTHNLRVSASVHVSCKRVSRRWIKLECKKNLIPGKFCNRLLIEILTEFNQPFNW